MSGVPKAVYRARVERVRQLAQQGLQRHEIAAMVGLTKDGVNGLCRRNRISTKRLTCTEHAHPLVRRLLHIMNEQRASIPLVDKRAGLGRDVIRNWKTRTIPRVDNLEAAFNVLGYELTIRPKREAD